MAFVIGWISLIGALLLWANRVIGTCISKVNAHLHWLGIGLAVAVIGMELKRGLRTWGLHRSVDKSYAAPMDCQVLLAVDGSW